MGILLEKSKTFRMTLMNFYNFILIFSLFSCSDQSDFEEFFVRKYSTQPGVFGVISYQLNGDTLFKNINGYIADENKLYYNILSKSEQYQFSELIKDLFVNFKSVDSTLHNPIYYFEIFNKNKNLEPILIFSNVLSSYELKFINKLKDMTSIAEMKHIEEPYTGIEDLHITHKILPSSNDTIKLSSFESFNLWLDMMAANKKKIKKNEISKEFVKLIFMYPAGYKNIEIKDLFQGKSGEFVALYENDVVIELQ